MQKIWLFLSINIFLVFTAKSMQHETTYKLNEHSIKMACKATQCSIAWALQRNDKLNLFKGPSCSFTETVSHLKIYCSALEKIALESETTTEFQERSKEIAQSPYCAHVLYKEFVETLYKTLSPFPNKTRHRRSSSETIAKKS